MTQDELWSKAKRWFSRNWRVMRLTDTNRVNMTWSEFREACKEAYVAGYTARRKEKNT